MSRLYEVEIHIKNPDGGDEGNSAIESAIRKWAPNIDDAFDSSEEDRDLCYTGMKQLCGGANEYDAHEELRGLLPKGYKLTTKWLCREYADWDEVISDG